METLGPVGGGLNDTVLAGRTNKRRDISAESIVSVVEFNAIIDKLLLSKDGKLISTETVGVILQEGIVSCVARSVHVLLNLVDRAVISCRLGRSWVTSTVS